MLTSWIYEKMSPMVGPWRPFGRQTQVQEFQIFCQAHESYNIDLDLDPDLDLDLDLALDRDLDLDLDIDIDLDLYMIKI